MRLALHILSYVGSLALASTANSASLGECLNGLRPALLAGDFSGSVDCQEDRLSVDYVGEVQKFGRTFDIYSYRYRLKPTCPKCAVHGGQRIFFMEGGRYLGQYKPTSVLRAVIHNGDLVFEAPNQEPVTVGFTRIGPPDDLWVDGEVLELFK